MTHNPYSSKCDIWSLGVVIYELTCLEYPFKAKDVAGLQKKAAKGEYGPIPDHFNKNLGQLISCCLKVEPTERYTAKMLLEHECFMEPDGHMTNTFLKHKRTGSEKPPTVFKDKNIIKKINMPKNLTSLNALMP